MASGDRLARVHRLRVVLRRQAQDAVSRVRGALAALAEETASARAAQDATRVAEETAARTGLPGADLRRLRAYEAVARAREEHLLVEAARLGQTLATSRESLLTRRREERQLERLTERARVEREAAEERTMTALLDDLARRRRR